jgi:hypothetical protein
MSFFLLITCCNLLPLLMTTEYRFNITSQNYVDAAVLPVLKSSNPPCHYRIQHSSSYFKDRNECPAPYVKRANERLWLANTPKGN